MAPRPDVSEERREQILEAATMVFARLGFRKARMDDVAEESRLSKGALYLYFRSKDDLIAALLHRIFNREMAGLRRLLTAQAPASDRLRSLNRQMADDVKRLSVLLPIWFEFYALAGRQKGVRQFLKTYFTEYRDVLAALIQQGIDDGEFRAVDAGATAVTVIALYEGLTLLWALDPERIPITDYAESSINLLMTGIQAGEKTGQSDKEET